MSYTDYDSEVEYFSSIGGWLKKEEEKEEEEEKEKEVEKEEEEEKEEKENIFSELSNLIIKKYSHIISQITEYENPNKRKLDDKSYAVKKKKI